MPSNIPWQEFCLLYYDVAMKYAEYHLNNCKSTLYNWDKRIDEEAVKVDVVMDSLQKAYTKYDPSKGANMNTFLSTVIHNAMVDEVSKEMKALSSVRGVSLKQEEKVSVESIAEVLPELTKDKILYKLRSAITQLSPIDQSILSNFLKDPDTFIEKSAKALNVRENYVSVRKNRALAKLRDLMGVTREDYFDMFEMRYFYLGTSSLECMKAARPGYQNPIDPEFDLEATANRLYLSLMATMHK